MIDFVHQFPGHRLEFHYGSALAAHFLGESKLVRFKDCVLLRNQSGRVGIWHLYSVIYHAPNRFKAIGKLVGYQEDYDTKGVSGERDIQAVGVMPGALEGVAVDGTGPGTSAPRIRGLLAAGSGPQG